MIPKRDYGVKEAIWGAFFSAEVGVRKGRLCFSVAGPSCPCQGWSRGLWRAWSKGRTSGHLKCWSPCPQTLLRKGLMLGLVPFSSFISTEEWLELCDLFHQHSWLKLNCRVQVKNELKPFLEAHSAILTSIPYQEGNRRGTPFNRMCTWGENRRRLHELQEGTRDPKMHKLCPQGA